MVKCFTSSTNCLTYSGKLWLSTPATFCWIVTVLPLGRKSVKVSTAGFPSITAVLGFKRFPWQMDIDLPGASFAKITDIIVLRFMFRNSGHRCCGITPRKLCTFVQAVWLQSLLREVQVSSSFAIRYGSVLFSTNTDWSPTRCSVRFVELIAAQRISSFLDAQTQLIRCRWRTPKVLDKRFFTDGGCEKVGNFGAAREGR